MEGYKIPLPLVPLKTKRYLRLSYAVATGPFTAGALTAGLVLDDQTNGSDFIKETNTLL